MKKIWLYVSVAIALIACNNESSQEVTTGKSEKIISEDSLLTIVQRQTFQYFWEGAEPVSGLARERFHVDGEYPQNDKHIITSGGSGFGVMALLVGIERGFITKEEGIERLKKVLDFLETADAFHGAWPHWWNGETGKVKPFSKKDDGGDLVETSFMAQALICVYEYFKMGNEEEKRIAAKADKLWKMVDFNFYRNGTDALYWHWSPQYGWEMNFPVKGYNECLIMYVLGAASPKYGIEKKVYEMGWGDSGRIVKPGMYKDIPLQFNHQGNAVNGGPLFWAHYSFLGLDPRGLIDQYGDYGKEVVNQSKINYQWCVDNPKGYKGYGVNSWGLTASYSVKGYAAHAPSDNDDLGVITPTAAISSIPYTPKESLAAIRYWYTDTTMKNKLWGPYGFYDAFSETDNWYPQRYLAIDQGPIVIMIENYRTQLLWNLFMRNENVQNGLKKLGFQSPHFK